MTAHPNHILQSDFYGLHCNLLLSLSVNHLFLLEKKKEKVCSTIKKILVRKKNTAMVIKCLIQCLTHHTSFVSGS